MNDKTNAPPPQELSLGWRPVSCLKLRMTAEKLRKADPSDVTAALLEEAAADIEHLESLHRSEIADMAERFRSVNVSEAMAQLADILPLNRTSPETISVGAAEPDGWICEDEFTLEAEQRDEWVEEGLSPKPFYFAPPALAKLEGSE